MLKRIKIKGYKSLEDIDVTLNPLSVLLGPNASGKSNFLDALQLISQIANSRTLKDAFKPPYRGKPLESFTFGENGIKDLLKQETATFSIEIDVELSNSVIQNVNKQIYEMKKTKELTTPYEQCYIKESSLRYRIEIEIIPKSGFLKVSDEHFVALNKNGTENKGRKPFLSKVGDKLHLRMEGQAHPTYYDRFLDHAVLSLPHYPPHYPHLVALRQELASWFFFYFEPRMSMRADNTVRETRHIGLMGEELSSFLNTLKALEPMQFEIIEKSLKLTLDVLAINR